VNAPGRACVFGYGSLVADGAGCIVAILRGWRRCWGVAMDNRLDLAGYKSYRLRSDGSRPAVSVAFLDIVRDPASAVTGICIPVDDRRLAELDARERNYDRVDVTSAIDGDHGTVWAYVGSGDGRARLRDGLSRGRAVVSRDYLAAAVAAVAGLAPREAAAIGHDAEAEALEALDLERIELA
jgi:hypothetical protein